MLTIQPWTSITAFGDSAVLLPCAALMLLWLWALPDSRGLAWRWAALFVAVAGLVAGSKLVFMAWGWGIRRLDFIGLSGHSAMAALVWPSLFVLACGSAPRFWRGMATASGLLVALLVAVSRLVLHVHSTAEVVAGFVVGATAALLFLLRHGERWQLGRQGWLLAIAVALVLPFVYGHRFPSERLLRFVAQGLSLDNTVYTRRYFREHGD
ncbi:phosphatase PAP2 family protein [Dyella sp. C9]|uniref:phosphatase PAP2 family protein n=1 Tax=Dyella sp. C9 TaxID=2202154 RepID=UPI000DEFDA1D|nr:phosphatase PAP2 family protein [Dyella sp. C9]